MSNNELEITEKTSSSSSGADLRTTKRNSGLFSFFKWFKSPGTASKESINTSSSSTSSLTSSDSSDSIHSTYSTGTVASFSFVAPDAYTKNHIVEKSIAPGPETDTYKARLKQREKFREKDKNVTLRKKYNLFFNKETLLKPNNNNNTAEEDNSKSLPLMTKKPVNEEQDRLHRRTASESSKIRKAGAYCHVKGKRKAPQPPIKDDTFSLRRKKRIAPPPPVTKTSRIEDNVENKMDNNDVISNDSLKLDHGILKSAKDEPLHIDTTSPNSSRLSYIEAPVSPRPWYKRNVPTTVKKDKHDASSSERLPELQYARNSTTELNIEEIKIDAKIKKEDKRKSGISFLTNISELDREAAELLNKKDKEVMISDMPAFMRPKPEQMNTDTITTPKRKSAKDLIAKFNAITNVTKVTVNNAFQREKRDYFGAKSSTKTQDIKKLTAKKNHHGETSLNPLMKSESASVIKPKPEVKETPKPDRKSWYCPKCYLENDYWRIICHVCSTIKPYFDDLSAPPTAKNIPNTSIEDKTEFKQQNPEIKLSKPPEFERNLERSKTQIGFSALVRYNDKKEQKFDGKQPLQEEKIKETTESKKEEREKLIKMLIEMKNSLPKKKINANKGNKRTKEIKEEIKQNNTQKEVLLVTQKTIYENIKVTQNQRPQKVSSSAQTSAVLKKTPSVTGAIKKDGSFELIKPKDFAEIYNEKMGKPDGQHLYANLGKLNPISNDSMSIFVNIPQNLSDLKKMNLSGTSNNMDTLEINRLLRRLETAIAKGELTDAAVFARELAQLKVNCSVIRQKENSDQEQKKGTKFTVNMFVEDKLSHRGPFPIQVTAEETVGELKKQIEKDFEIPANVQRWILGKELATDDKSTLKDHHVTTNGCPVFLYLVAPSRDSKVPEKPKEQDNPPKQLSEIPSTSKNTDQKIEKVEIQKTEPKLTNDTKDLLLLTQPSTSQQAKIVNEVITEVVTISETKIESAKIGNRKSLSIDEDYGDYDCKTLKPQTQDWECKMCTLLNPPTSNICAVCATIRQKGQPVPPTKVGKRKAPQPHKRKTTETETKALHLQLLDLDNGDLVVNTEVFECMVCLMEIGNGDGVTLRECLHQFCKQCLAYTVEFTDDAEIKCPYRDDQYSCDIALQDREIKALVAPNIYEQYLARSVAQVENKIEKSFHCKTPDCKGWCIFEDNVNEFKCPVCLKLNCLTCQAIHTGMNCKQYQEKMNEESDVDENAKRTREMLEEMVNKGEALTCPVCQVILMKKWGCDWVRCSMCKTEICWVTRGPRWGPAGKGTPPVVVNAV
ncbi:ubiquitin conjugating enzyme 7 interacting protein-related [Holotrichia oblita]|uniref:Ubiquitin conjugating enzyme 7 interacting protein-related n=1 Tax=Holotrichia oblita TaxID=644536 RepID=A0ACB9TCJ5_HOLOL|nr:ubiquitin conjugating enzyme 7 interacting protein-related [Holotrichia oblita]